MFHREASVRDVAGASCQTDWRSQFREVRSAGRAWGVPEGSQGNRDRVANALSFHLKARPRRGSSRFDSRVASEYDERSPETAKCRAILDRLGRPWAALQWQGWWRGSWPGCLYSPWRGPRRGASWLGRLCARRPGHSQTWRQSSTTSFHVCNRVVLRGGIASGAVQAGSEQPGCSPACSGVPSRPLNDGPRCPAAAQGCEGSRSSGTKAALRLSIHQDRPGGRGGTQAANAQPGDFGSHSRHGARCAKSKAPRPRRGAAARRALCVVQAMDGRGGFERAR